MKYHYQFVSRTTVRIELIPEDKKEIALLQKQSQATANNEQLTALFSKGLEAYSTGAQLMQIKFMSFPTVALCNHSTAVQNVENVA